MQYGRNDGILEIVWLTILGLCHFFLHKYMLNIWASGGSIWKKSLFQRAFHLKIVVIVEKIMLSS